MKVIGFVSSPRKRGNTDILVNEVLSGAKEKGAETEVLYLNNLNIKCCQSCLYCRTNDGCSIKDDMQEIYRKIKQADAVVFGSPVYMFHVNAQAKAFIDRLFPFLILSDYSSKINKSTVTVYTQGSPDTSAFSTVLEMNNKALSLNGLKVKDTIIVGNGNEKGSVSKNHDVLAKARDAGKSLLN